MTGMSNSLAHLRRSVAVCSLAWLILACASPTGPTSVHDILAHRAVWDSQRLADYSYTYQTFGGFLSHPPGPLQIEVRGDTVRAVVDLATGDSLVATYLPTIDALFDRALAAAENGSLTGIVFDRVRGYPTRLDYAAVPDKAQSEQASSVQPIP